MYGYSVPVAVLLHAHTQQRVVRLADVYVDFLSQISCIASLQVHHISGLSAQVSILHAELVPLLVSVEESVWVHCRYLLAGGIGHVHFAALGHI